MSIGDDDDLLVRASAVLKEPGGRKLAPWETRWGCIPPGVRSKLLVTPDKETHESWLCVFRAFGVVRVCAFVVYYEYDWLRRNDKDMGTLAWELDAARRAKGFGGLRAVHQLGNPEKRKRPLSMINTRN